jgi:hypothetical protein
LREKIEQMTMEGSEAMQYAVSRVAICEYTPPTWFTCIIKHIENPKDLSKIVYNK